jgi:hypothetical protein
MYHFGDLQRENLLSDDRETTTNHFLRPVQYCTKFSANFFADITHLSVKGYIFIYGFVLVKTYRFEFICKKFLTKGVKEPEYKLNFRKT